MQWADIEVPDPPIDKDSKGGQACYPLRTFDPMKSKQIRVDYSVTIADIFISDQHVCFSVRDNCTIALLNHATVICLFPLRTLVAF